MKKLKGQALGIIGLLGLAMIGLLAMALVLSIGVLRAGGSDPADDLPGIFTLGGPAVAGGPAQVAPSLQDAKIGLSAFVKPASITPRDRGTRVSQVSGTTPNFKVAFLGDQGLGANAEAVLQLVQAEGADMVLHQGDFGYNESDPQTPTNWDNQINSILGPNFPYFGSVGNHDVGQWAEYQQYLQERLDRVAGAACSGNLGVQSICHYNGLFFILSGAGTMGSGHDAYLRDQLALDDSVWSICSWHKNQNAMQVGSKPDEVGWGPYEECRLGGAIIATGHEHSYERTKTLSNLQSQTVDPLWTDPNVLRVGGGSTFVFVSGISGLSIRNQTRCLPTFFPYGCNGEWAKISTSDQGAQFGALFIEFHVDGDPRKARGYFKNIDGVTVDSFTIMSDPDRPVTVTFQEGDSGYTGTLDTHIKEGDPGASFGSLSSVEWDSVATEAAGLPKIGLISFQNIFGTGSGQIPVGATIHSANLTYTVFDAGDTANVHDVAVDWVETVTFDSFGGDAGVQADEFGPLVGTGGGVIGANLVDVTSSLASWSNDPTGNHGWIFLPTGGNGVDLRSSEWGTIVERPKLTAVFSLPPSCTLELTPSYAAGTLTVNILVGTNVAATANIWGTAGSNIASLVTGPVPVIEPPITTAITKPLPPSGTVGILATLTLPGLGIICSDFKTVDTGFSP